MTDYAWLVTYQTDIQQWYGEESDQEPDDELTRGEDICIIEPSSKEYDIDTIEKTPEKVFKMKPLNGVYDPDFCKCININSPTYGYVPDFSQWEITYYRAVNAERINVREKCIARVRYQSKSGPSCKIMDVELPGTFSSETIEHDVIPHDIFPDFTDEEGTLYVPEYATLEMNKCE